MLHVSASTGTADRRFTTTSYVPWQPARGPVTAVSANRAPIGTVAAFTLQTLLTGAKKNRKIDIILVNDKALFNGRPELTPRKSATTVCRVSPANLLSTLAKDSSAYEIFSAFPTHALCVCQVTLLMPRKMVSSFVRVSLSAQGHTAVPDSTLRAFADYRFNGTRFSHRSNLVAKGEGNVPPVFQPPNRVQLTSPVPTVDPPPLSRYNPNGLSATKNGATSLYRRCSGVAGRCVPVRLVRPCHKTCTWRANSRTQNQLQLHAASLQQSACCSYTLPRYNNQHVVATRCLVTTISML